jgi:acetyl esterase/lipase
MPLDPQARAWLDAGVAAGMRPYQELGVEESRRLIDANARGLFGALEEVARVEDVDLDGVPGRLYEPMGAGPGALVWLHGGGWTIGSLESHDPLCRALSARSGSRVVAVDYRLAPEHPHPAALEDAWTATKWAVGAFGPVAVGGDSAGGHLAAVGALRARDRGVPLRLQALVVPVTDYAFATASYTENATGYGLERKTMEWFWDLFVPDRADAADLEVSPLRAPDVSATAPALVVTAEYDPLRDEGEAYAAKLRDGGVDVEHRRAAGMVHGFLRMPGVIERAGETIDRVAARVREALSAESDAPV